MPDFYTGLIALIEDIRQKDTSPAFDSDTDSLEAIRERIDALAGATWSTETLVAIKAAVDSRLATSGYTAPDNSGIAAVKAKTDNLPSSPANEATLTAIKGTGWADQTLVAIKSGVDAIVGPDTPAVAAANTGDTSYQNVLSYTGSGILVGISQMLYPTSNTNGYGSLKIILDGTTMLDGYFTFGTFSSSSGGSQNSLAFDMPFSTSLTVQHKVGSSDMSSRTIVTYKHS
jgi:hypothetical protein